MAKARCPNERCKHKNVAGARYCARCGRKLSETEYGTFRRGSAEETWERPCQNTQPTLFPGAVDECLAACGVPPDVVRRWRRLGWISFDIDDLGQIDEPEEFEICFVRNIAQSGLPEDQINNLLSELDKPYSYDPVRTAYHFDYGWVVPRFELNAEDLDVDETYDVVEANISDWIAWQGDEGNLGQLKELRDQIDEYLTGATGDRGRGERG